MTTYFIDTYKSNNIKIGVNDMTVNDSEMCVRWKDEASFFFLSAVWSAQYINSPQYYRY